VEGEGIGPLRVSRRNPVEPEFGQGLGEEVKARKYLINQQ
jgi:hypothetical protein